MCVSKHGVGSLSGEGSTFLASLECYVNVHITTYLKKNLCVKTEQEDYFNFQHTGKMLVLFA